MNLNTISLPCYARPVKLGLLLTNILALGRNSRENKINCLKFVFAIFKDN
jgi:hypothetical protein